MKRILITIAFAGIVVVGVAAQQRQGGPAARYTPAPGAKDLRAVLFNWAWYMGMLRGPQENEAVATLELKATGTMQVDGQPCRLTKYRISNNYQLTGERIQIACTRPNGQTYQNVEVVSGQYAWDEDTPGAEIVAGKGKATPRANLLRERLIRLWASPQGAVKAAAAAKENASVSWDTGKAVVTFPIPGVAGAIAKATLSAQNQAEHVEVRDGAVVTTFDYAKYDDYNNPLNKIEAFMPGTMIEKRNGVAVRDLTTTETETGNLYVIMPVPASVRKSASPQSN
jgi:hypothetical protein